MEIIQDTTPIEKYRESDSGDRIFLYLEHRYLRSEFSAIDMAEAKRKSELATEKLQSSVSKHSWLDPMRKVLWGIFQTTDRQPIANNK